MQEEFTIIDFRKRFNTEKDCLKYLMEHKWGGGFKCLKCENDKWSKGRQWYYKRCKSCGHDESATANTMFHKCKMGLLKAFEIGFIINMNEKGMSSYELGKEFRCHQRSARLLKSKFKNAGSPIDFTKILEQTSKVA